MAAINPAAAATAYQNIQSPSGLAQPSAVAKTTDGGFAAALEDAAKSAMETLQKSEQVSTQAAAGDADLLEVVSAVNDAEATLRTVVSVRDKVVQSYQEILRMPV